MKILLLTIALLATIEAKAYQGWVSHNGPGYRRSNFPGRGPPWGHQNFPQNNVFGSNVEWVCQNPKTNDMMIIAADNGKGNSGRDPPGGQTGQWGQWQHVPPGHQWNNHGNYWTQPILVIQESLAETEANTVKNPSTSFPIKSETHNQPQTTSPSYHGGEGLIDVRAGSK